MIELIFALVIMGIALMSAPMLINQSISSSNVALQQEAIASLSTHLGIVLSKPWDENDTNESMGLPRIITLNNYNNNNLQDFNGIKNIPDSTRKIDYLTNPVLASAIGRVGDKNASEFNDIDDYNGMNTRLTLFNNETATAGNLGDYVDLNITIATTVTFADDMDENILATTLNVGNKIFTTPNLGLTGGVVNESHIKFVNAVLTGNPEVAELNKTITLKAFSCNLGAYNLGSEQY